MTEQGSFESTLAKLVTVFEGQGVSYALIGGLAVAAWGTPRATEDIDFLAEVTRSSQLDAVLRAAGFNLEWRRGDPEDPIPLLLRLTSGAGPEVDILCATRSWETEMLSRAVRVTLSTGLEAQVVAVEDLIVLKLLAGGPGDLTDVADLLQRVGHLPQLEQRAAVRGVAQLLSQVMTSIRP